jgi:two-component system, NtrC family, response regulator AtoC
MNQLENKAKANKNINPLTREEVFADNPVAADQPQTDAHFSLRSLRAEAEIYAISRTLEYTGWNRRRAAQLLSISYRGILYKIRQHNLTPSAVRQVAPLGQTLKVE